MKFCRKQCLRGWTSTILSSYIKAIGNTEYCGVCNCVDCRLHFIFTVFQWYSYSNCEPEPVRHRNMWKFMRYNQISSLYVNTQLATTSRFFFRLQTPNTCVYWMTAISKKIKIAFIPHGSFDSIHLPSWISRRYRRYLLIVFVKNVGILVLRHNSNSNYFRLNRCIFYFFNNTNVNCNMFFGVLLSLSFSSSTK